MSNALKVTAYEYDLLISGLRVAAEGGLYVTDKRDEDAMKLFQELDGK